MKDIILSVDDFLDKYEGIRIWNLKKTKETL